jgi:CBS domain-containing protein
LTLLRQVEAPLRVKTRLQGVPNGRILHATLCRAEARQRKKNKFPREVRMTIARILADKGRHVSTIPADQSLAESAALLTTENIGALVVTDADGWVLGILSERDIVRAIAASGASALGQAVSQHMTTPVITVDEHECANAAMGKMTNQRIRHLPVIKDRKLDGLVSIGDLVKFRLAEMEQQHQELKEYIASA